MLAIAFHAFYSTEYTQTESKEEKNVQIIKLEDAFILFIILK